MFRAGRSNIWFNMEFYKIKGFTKFSQYLFYYGEIVASFMIPAIVFFNHLNSALYSGAPIHNTVTFFFALLLARMVYLGAKIQFGHHIIGHKIDKISSLGGDYEIVSVTVRMKDGKVKEGKLETK